jgi:hypothetical protein
MTLGLAFWIIMLIWAVFSLAFHFGYVAGVYGGGVDILLLFVLFAILGWQIFGPPIRREAR